MRTGILFFEKLHAVMARLSFGIDISDDLLSGVAVAGNGKEAKAVSCAFYRLDQDNELVEQLPLLLEELQWPQNGHCDIGLSLSELSLRNITLPFADNKKSSRSFPLNWTNSFFFQLTNR